MEGPEPGEASEHVAERGQRIVTPTPLLQELLHPGPSTLRHTFLLLRGSPTPPRGAFRVFTVTSANLAAEMSVRAGRVLKHCCSLCTRASGPPAAPGSPLRHLLHRPPCGGFGEPGMGFRSRGDRAEPSLPPTQDS